MRRCRRSSGFCCGDRGPRPRDAAVDGDAGVGEREQRVPLVVEHAAVNDRMRDRVEVPTAPGFFVSKGETPSADGELATARQRITRCVASASDGAKRATAVIAARGDAVVTRRRQRAGHRGRANDVGPNIDREERRHAHKNKASHLSRGASEPAHITRHFARLGDGRHVHGPMIREDAAAKVRRQHNAL